MRDDFDELDIYGEGDDIDYLNRMELNWLNAEMNFNGEKHITNFSNIDLDTYEKALIKFKESGSLSDTNKKIVLSIKGKAFCRDGTKLEDHSSLWTNSPYAGLSIFWKIFKKVQVEERLKDLEQTIESIKSVNYSDEKKRKLCLELKKKADSLADSYL
jgi:hypothetical protein